MKKINTSPISGMQELLPAAAATFEKLKKKIFDTYVAHGFLTIETPVIDRCEILLAKAGGDTEKQIYKVVKTAEASDDADQALRFDHTVPLARYVVQHENDLTFPFKVSQIGRNFRGERAQRGRFREFYQCDVDVIGREKLPIAYDADVISTLLDAFLSFELGTPVLARINNRKILTGFLEGLEVGDKCGKIFDVIDHAEKVTEKETEEDLRGLELDSWQISKILKFIDLHGSREDVIGGLRGLGVQNEVFNNGVEELEAVLRQLEMDGKENEIEADMKIVRGLDYYTGTVFEFNLPEYKKVGSVCGGGRYENLAGHFTSHKLPGVGGSIGLTRLFYVLAENDLIKSQEERPVDCAVIPMSESEMRYSLEVARELRDEGHSATIVWSGKNMGEKLKYAAKIANKKVVIGENEATMRQYKIENLNF